MRIRCVDLAVVLLDKFNEKGLREAELLSNNLSLRLMAQSSVHISVLESSVLLRTSVSCWSPGFILSAVLWCVGLHQNPLHWPTRVPGTSAGQASHHFFIKRPSAQACRRFVEMWKSAPPILEYMRPSPSAPLGRLYFQMWAIQNTLHGSIRKIPHLLQEITSKQKSYYGFYRQSLLYGCVGWCMEDGDGNGVLSTTPSQYAEWNQNRGLYQTCHPNLWTKTTTNPIPKAFWSSPRCMGIHKCSIRFSAITLSFWDGSQTSQNSRAEQYAATTSFWMDSSNWFSVDYGTKTLSSNESLYLHIYQVHHQWKTQRISDNELRIEQQNWQQLLQGLVQRGGRKAQFSFDSQLWMDSGHVYSWIVPKWAILAFHSRWLARCAACKIYHR